MLGYKAIFYNRMYGKIQLKKEVELNQVPLMVTVEKSTATIKSNEKDLLLSCRVPNYKISHGGHR